MRSLALLCGVLAPAWLPPPACLLLLAAAAAWLAGTRRDLPALMLLVAGAALATLAGERLRLPAAADGERVMVEGRIDSVPAHAGDGWQFEFSASFVQHPGWPARRLRVSGWRGADVPRAGERWRLAVQLRLPRDARDWRAARRDRVAADARALGVPAAVRLAAATGSLDGWRERVADRIRERVADPAAAALLQALAVGVTGDVRDRQWRVFSVTGVSHLVAISGMHVTFFAMLSMAAARWAWRRCPPLAAVVRRDCFAALAGVSLALAYALLSGFSVPAQRTVAMLSAFLAVRECARATGASHSLAAALVAVLLWDPGAPLGAGFWLSFAAVALIIGVAGARLVPLPALRAAAVLQVLITVALLPLTVAWFGSFSALGLVANVLAIPVFTVLLVPPVLLATACLLSGAALPDLLAGWLLDLAAAAAAWLWPWLATLADLPGASWAGTVRPAWLALAVPAVLALVLPAARRLRGAALAVLGAAFLWRDGWPAHGALDIHLVDVGAGEALVLRTASHQLLWGTGESFGTAGRRFERRVLPRLAGGRLDLWLPGRLSRDDQRAVLLADSRLRIGRIVLPARTSPPPEMRACTPQAWVWDAVRFALSPAGGGCQLTVLAAGRTLQLGADPPGGSLGADLLLLPRAARRAADARAGRHALLLASVSRAEWQGDAWRDAQARHRGAGRLLLATAGEGDVHLRVDAGGRIRRLPAVRAGTSFAARLFGYHSPPCGNSC